MICDSMSRDCLDCISNDNRVEIKTDGLAYPMAVKCWQWTAVWTGDTMKSSVFSDMMGSPVEVHWCFGGTYYPHHHGETISHFYMDCYTLFLLARKLYKYITGTIRRNKKGLLEFVWRKKENIKVCIKYCQQERLLLVGSEQKKLQSDHIILTSVKWQHLYMTLRIHDFGVIK
jgi:hypothetical protein